MLTVRLDPELEEFLNQYSEDRDLTKSSIVKEALELYFREKKIHEDPFGLGEEFFGQFGSGQKDRSTTYKQRVKKKLREKHSH